MKSALTVAVLLTIASAARAGGDDSSQPAKVVTTTLTQVRNTPEAFKHVSVQFPVQFVSLGKAANPFFTRFVPSDFANFYGWAAEQPIWQKNEYENMFGLFFMSKENEQLEDLYQLRLYDRLMVTGVVRNTFQGMPWIEVLGFTPLSQRLDTVTLSHLYRAEELMRGRQWSMAISEFALAERGDLPSVVRAALSKNLGVCYLRIGEAGTAVDFLNHAMSLGATDSDTELLLTTAMAEPERMLDRAVDMGAVRDSERPMWEAFEGPEATTPTQAAQPPAEIR